MKSDYHNFSTKVTNTASPKVPQLRTRYSSCNLIFTGVILIVGYTPDGTVVKQSHDVLCHMLAALRRWRQTYMDTQVKQVTQHKTGQISVSMAEENLLFVGSQCETCFMSTSRYQAPGVSECLTTPPVRVYRIKECSLRCLSGQGAGLGESAFVNFYSRHYHGSCWANEGTVRNITLLVNLAAPCMLYIGQFYLYSPEDSFYIFGQQIYLMIFLRLAAQSPFIPPQNPVFFIMLPFLVHKIFTFYTNDVLKFKSPAPLPVD